MATLPELPPRTFLGRILGRHERRETGRVSATYSEPAILEPIQYEPVLNDEGKRIGWQPSKADRRRFDQGSRYPGTGTHAITPLEPDELPAREIDEIVAVLEGWAIGDESLYDQLRALYVDKPLIADRIAAAAVQGAQSGSLYDPTAFLASRLTKGRRT